MTIHIKKYAANDFDNCIELFLSNADKFFDEIELQDYKAFLEKEALDGNYYVFKHRDSTVAAGGFFYLDNAYWFDWGIVHRTKHGLGIGNKLVEHRLKMIYKLSPNAIVKLCTSQYTVGFYEKHGFTQLSYAENGFGQNLHMYTLEKRRQ